LGSLEHDLVTRRDKRGLTEPRDLYPGAQPILRHDDFEIGTWIGDG
jgi:hypothetical protein